GFDADGVGDLRIDRRERALQKVVAGRGALFVNGGHLDAPRAAILLDNQRSMRRFAVPLLLSAFCLLLSYFCFFFHRDNFSTHYPIKVISASAFRAGEIPYWNPFDGGGQPLAGNPNPLTFYPDNFL